MATLAKVKDFVIPITSKHNRVFFNAVRHKVKTTFDWMPGPYPETEEQKIKAAEKYGLHPAEYKPYDPNGLIHAGDYPELPYIAKSLLDPHYPWDMPEDKRNFGEAIHFNVPLLSEDRTDIGERPLVGYWEAPLTFWGIVLAGFGINYLFDFYPNFQPRLEKQIPQPGVVHYSFEPATK